MTIYFLLCLTRTSSSRHPPLEVARFTYPIRCRDSGTAPPQSNISIYFDNKLFLDKIGIDYVHPEIRTASVATNVSAWNLFQWNELYFSALNYRHLYSKPKWHFPDVKIFKSSKVSLCQLNVTLMELDI